MLQTMVCLPMPMRNTNNLGIIFILRDLAVALSACIYQSLCDSDTFNVKHSHPHHETYVSPTMNIFNLQIKKITFAKLFFHFSGGMECLSRLSGLSTHGSHLMGGRHRRYSSTDDSMPVTTPPNKWPGLYFFFC